MSLDRTVFKKKPILVVRGARQFFIDRSQRAGFEAPGSRWPGDAEGKVHLRSGSYFVVGNDGKCRACKVARSSVACSPKKVRVLDITACRLPALLTRKNAERPDAKAYRRELKDFISRQPEDLRDKINSFVREDGTLAFSPEGLRKLSELARLPWRVFTKTLKNPGGKIRAETTVSWEPDEGQPLGPSLWADPRGRTAVLGALLKGLGKPYNSFEEAARAGNAAQKPTAKKQGWVERELRRLIAEERENNK